jgi:hypothetical protein
MVCLQASAGMPDNWLASSSGEKIDARIDRMLLRISKQNSSNDREQLRVIFKKTQKEFLHRYKPLASLEELAVGDFDCLTATSLFAEILTRAGFSFKVIETNYHIFLLARTREGDVLIETTDRFSGFITEQQNVRERIEVYRSQKASAGKAGGATTYQYGFKVCNEIDMTELSGLLHFNQAVKSYNEAQWKSCAENLVVADRHTESPRIAALATLLLSTVILKDVDETERQEIRRLLAKFDMSAEPMASR